MRISGIIACLAVVGGFVSCTVSSRGKVLQPVVDSGGYEGVNAPYYYHTEGIKSYRIKNNPQKALVFFNKALEADSTYAPAYYEIAQVLLDYMPEQAVDYIEKANKLDTANLTYRSHLGRALLMSERYDEALGIYTRLMKDDPNNAINYKLLAALYDFKGSPFTAIAVLDTAEMRLGRIEELSGYKREMLMNVRLYDKAIEETQKLIAEYPYDDNNYLFLANLYKAMGNDSLAMDNYGQAMRIDSANLATLTSLAEFYERKQDVVNYLDVIRLLFINEALPLKEKENIFRDITSDIEFYRRNYFAINSLALTLITHYPMDYGVLDLYANHLIKSGEIEQSLLLYKSFLNVNPDKIEPYLNILSIETYLTRPDSVARYAAMALERFPDNADIMVSAGYARVHMKDYPGALKMFREAYDKAKTDSLRSIMAGVLGDTYHEVGNKGRSYRMYRKALRYNPDNAGILNNYAYFLSEDGTKLKKALAMSDKSNKLSSGNSTFLDTQGWILYLLGNYEEARKLMQQAISFDRSNSEVLLFHYAEILYALDDLFMAEVYWKRALERGYSADIIEQRLKTVTGK